MQEDPKVDARHTPLELAPEELERLALAEHLCPVFQPLFDRHLRAVTYEALMRVVDTQGTLLSLADYVAQMEFNGLISLADIKMAHQVGEVLRHVRLPSVSVNASLATLEHRFHAYVAALGPANLRCGQVIIEITETTPMVDAGRLRACIEEVRAHGYLVALDDAKLGHPYGHPDLLNVAQPDIVKIDGQFFHEALMDRRKRRHLERIVAATHGFGGTVVFEWIDTPARHEMAHEMGADWVQGFLFGRPRSLWPSSMRLDASSRPCGHRHCAIAQDMAHATDRQLAPVRGAILSNGARKMDSSCSDSNSLKNGQIPPSAS